MARTYETIRLESRYAPWRDDEAFQRVYTQIKSSTLIDECRCWNLWRLVEQSSKLEGGHLIEIGVWRGGSGILIATQAAMCGIWDMVFLCDTFSGVVKAGPQDAVYRGGEHADTSLAAVTDLVVHHNLHNVITVAGPMPESWVDCGYSDFRFCHIDVFQ